jgi:hypothetical protein
MHRWVAVLSVAMVAACGAHGPVVGPQPDASAEAAAPVLVCDSLAPTKSPTDAFGDACSFAGGATPTIAAVVGKTLVTVDHSGAVRTLHTFFEDAPELTPPPFSYPRVIHRGAYVAAAEMATNAGAARARFEIVIVGLDGTVLATRIEEMSGGAPNTFFIAGNDAGLFAYQWNFDELRGGLGLLTAKGDVGFFPGVELGTDPGEDGIIGVYKMPVGAWSDPIYWLDTCAGTMTRSHAPDFNLYIQPLDGIFGMGERILYLDRAASALVLEGPHDLKSLVVAGLDEPHNGTRVQGVDPAGWVLVTGPEYYPPWITANVATGESHVLAGAFPAGESLINPPTAWPGPAFELDGASVTALLRDANAGHLYIDTNDAWQTMGTPIGDIFWSTSLAWSGTYLFEGHWQGDNGAMQYENWPAPQGPRLDGSSMQLLNPSHGTSIVVENPAPPDTFGRIWNLSHDAACVSYFDNGTLRVVSAATGARAAFDLSAFAQPVDIVASTFVQDGDDLGME